MAVSTERTRSTRRAQRWLLLGASGVLQPLSEEFLYCASADKADHTWRRRGQVVRGRHVKG